MEVNVAGAILDRLARTPPAEFVSVRDDAVAELRAGGAREEAARVRRLRRPAPAVWGANAVAWRHRDLVAAAVDAAAAVRAAQDPHRGADREDAEPVAPDALRHALRRYRAAVAAVSAEGRRALDDIGASAAQHDRLDRLVELLTVDPASTDTWLAGRLFTEPEAPDPSLLLGTGSSGRARGPDRVPPPDPELAARAAFEEAEASLAVAEGRAAEAGTRLETAERSVERLQQRLAEAQRVREAARRDAKQHDLAVRTLRRKVQTLRRELPDADGG